MPKRRIALVLSEDQAASLSRSLPKLDVHALSYHDCRVIDTVERELRRARSGGGQADAAIMERVYGAKSCTLNVTVEPRLGAQ